ncbi:unnamed protein product [Prorocentrum cordatum]|uniref:Uncharacterized protein n=1 Tax=Prorocentrum cordatum TaxID=2364126 RepID=A0ABN9V7Q0_9DINO|nr:unnamed protein product [Polarella glacialis]
MCLNASVRDGDVEAALEKALNETVNARPALAEAAECFDTITTFKTRWDVAKRPLNIALKLYPVKSLPLLGRMTSDPDYRVRLTTTNTWVKAARALRKRDLPTGR